MTKKVEEKKVVLLSHSERLAQPSVPVKKSLYGTIEKRVLEDFVERGRIFKKAVYKTVNPADNFKGMSALDFALENIIAVGAIDSLKSCNLNGNTLNVADECEVSVNNIISAVDAETKE